MKFRHLLVVLSIGLFTIPHADAVDNQLEVLLSTSPEASAEKSFAGGNAQYLVIPACGELIPGYPVAGMMSEPPAMKNAHRPAGTCEQLLGKEKMDRLHRLRVYAEAHNRRLHELQTKKATVSK